MFAGVVLERVFAMVIGVGGNRRKGAEVNVQNHIAVIAEAMAALRGALDEPATSFDSLEAAMVALEEVWRSKTYMDARFAYLAEGAEAAGRAGTHHVGDYLTRTLGISAAEARTRIAAGKDLFAPIEPRKVEEKDFLHLVDADRGAAMDMARQREKQRANEGKKHQESARELVIEVATDKLAAIDSELKRLNSTAATSREELYAEALNQARARDVDDLRRWVRERVRAANRTSRTVAGKRDRLAAHRKREVWVSRPDSDGGVRFGGYLPAGMAANLAAALAAGRNAGSNVEGKPKDDKRTLRQRRADQLNAICMSYVHDPAKARAGRASLVITGTVGDFHGVGVDTQFMTNTGHELNALEVVQATSQGADYWLLCEEGSQRPLNLGRAQRGASFEQRLVLAATELVCSCPGCDMPASECDAHHLKAFIQGGRTDIENLTLLCRRHHTDNNDARDGKNGLGYYARDAESGKVGWYPPHGPPRFNTTVARSRAPGVRLATRHGVPSAVPT